MENRRMYLIVGVVLLMGVCLWQMGLFTYSPSEDDRITTVGDALVKCEQAVEDELDRNLSFEGAVALGASDRIDERRGERYVIQSWYDAGNGEQRYTCDIDFGSGPDDYTVTVSNGW